MSGTRRVIELITKLIRDTNDNRIYWRPELPPRQGVKEIFLADYDDLYKLVFQVFSPVQVFSPEDVYHLSLSDTNEVKLLDYSDSVLSDLYDVILAQGGSDKLDEAIEHILQS